ncbi:16S rRNA (cytidine(1402)-2'-O)-methyltransferase [bacterium]|nr:16S rRNA (cytidine(1402)-2'-O)-methyltransferase [bacterium]
MKSGTLYIVGTPIGNLEDITLRALRTLREVDLIACEDTRRTRKLLSRYNIHTSLTSYFEHNKIVKADFLIGKLKEDKNIALVSDAGMPGISDPGYFIIQRALKENISIIPIPGPTALISSLVISGLPTDSFIFEGFLPSMKKARCDKLKGLKSERKTIILYEAPHRLITTLRDILEILGDREVSLTRELTKKFEETFRGKVSEAIEKFVKPKGEFTIILKGAQEKEILKEKWQDLPILDHLKLVMKEENLAKKEAIKRVATLRRIPKREVYQISLKLKA